MAKPIIVIRLDPLNVNFPLRQIYVGQGSTLRLRLTGFDAALFTAAVFIHPVVEGGTPARFDAALNAATGFHEVKVEGWSLTVPGTADYEIVIYDSEIPEGATAKDPYWSGWGKIVVKPSLIDAVIPELPEGQFPAGYVQHPVTGLWSKIVGEVNDLGQLTLTTIPVDDPNA